MWNIITTQTDVWHGMWWWSLDETVTANHKRLWVIMSTFKHMVNQTLKRLLGIICTCDDRIHLFVWKCKEHLLLHILVIYLWISYLTEMIQTKINDVSGTCAESGFYNRLWATSSLSSFPFINIKPWSDDQLVQPLSHLKQAVLIHLILIPISPICSTET